ncbi:MlrC C-terminal domain-containing protein, partial [Burkholderia sp. SIMBA_013]
MEAKVLKLDDPGAADQRQGVVGIGGIIVILAARRRPYHMISDFTRLGFDRKAVRLLVVKSGYLSPEL